MDYQIIIWAVAIFFLIITPAFATNMTVASNAIPVPSPLPFNAMVTHYTSYAAAVGACAICSVNEINLTKPYGTVPNVAAGKDLYYPEKNSSANTNYVYNVIVVPNPSYICINMTGTVGQRQVFQSSDCSPGQQSFPLVAFGNHFGLNTSFTTVNVIATISSTLVGSQTVPYTADMNVEGTTLYDASNLNTNTISVTKAFQYNAGGEFTISIEGGGNANYTAEDPVVVPGGASYYQNIPIQNTQGGSYTANTQVFFNYPANTYNTYLAANLMNIEAFNGVTGAVIPMWIAGNTLNMQFSQANLYNSANVLLVIKLPDTINGLTTDSNIYLAYFTTTTPEWGTNLGAAPELWCASGCPSTIYAGVDNGNIIFPGNYWNFTGVSLPPGWQFSAASYSVSNGLILSGSASSYYVYYGTSESTSTLTYIADWFGTASIGGGNFEGGGFVNPSTQWDVNGGQSTYHGQIRTSAGHFGDSAAVGVSENEIFSTFGNTLSLGWFQDNLTGPIVQIAPSGGGSMSQMYPGFFQGAPSPTFITANWFDVRTAPPNNVNAIVTFGAVTPVSSSLTATLSSCVTNTIVDQGQYQSCTTSITGGTATYTANFIISNSITKSNVANDIIYTGVSTSQVATWYVGANEPTNSPLEVNVIAIDSVGAVANSVYSGTYNAYPTLFSTLFTVSNAIVDQNEYQLLTTTVTGGASTYTYNFLVYNSVTLTTNELLSGSVATTNTFLFKVPTSATGTFRANVFVTDSATTAVTVSNTITFTVDSALNANPPTPSNPTIDNGQSITLTANPTGGTGSYTYQWYTDSGNNCISLSIIVGATSSTYVASPSSSTYYCYIVTDTATIPAVATSTAPTLVTVSTAMSQPTIAPAGNSNQAVGNTVTFNSYVTGGTGALTYNFIIYNSITNIQVANSLVTYNGFAYSVPSGQSGNTLYANVFVTDQAYSPVTLNSIHSGVITVLSSSTENAPYISGFTTNIIYGSQPTLTVNGQPEGHIINVYFTPKGSAQGAAAFTGVTPYTYTLCSGGNYCPGIGAYTVNVFDTDPSSNILNTIVYVPVNLINVTGTRQFLNLNPYVACSNNFAGGNCIGNVIYTNPTTLTRSVFVVGNILINPGIVVQSASYSFVISGNFYNKGTIIANSLLSNGASGSSNAPSNVLSFGGSGGAGHVGAGGMAPSITSSLTNGNIENWWTNGLQNYLIGAGGGAAGVGTGNGGSTQAAGGIQQAGGSLDSGKAGSYGIYIQANAIVPGNILAGGNGYSASGGDGCGGGGVVVFAYNGAIASNTLVSVAGGTGCSGGNGGNGQIANYQWTSQPIPVVLFNETYPILFQTISPSSLISYTTTQTFNGISNVVQSSAINVNFQPYVSALAGIYQYNFTETQGANVVSLFANITLNMTNILSTPTFTLPIIQEGPNFVLTPTFNQNPTSWCIQSDNPLNQYSNTVTGCQWSNANQIFSPSFVLTYNGFAPYVASSINNPKIVSITQNALVFVTTNIIPTNGVSRQVFNETGFDLQFFTTVNIPTQRSDSFQFLFNNYSGLFSYSFAANTFPNNAVKTYMPISLYQNANVMIQNYTTAATSTGYSGTTVNNYCPVNLGNGFFENSFSYLPNVNATQTSMSVLLSNGNPATNYTLILQTQNPTVSVLSYKMVAAAGFSIYLEPNQFYRFLVYDKKCLLVYTSPYNRWSSPIALTVPSGPVTPPPFLPTNLSAVHAACVNTPQASNVMQTYCTFSNQAVPPEPLSWRLNVYSAPYQSVICTNTITSASNSMYCFTSSDNIALYSTSLDVNFNNGAGWFPINTTIFGKIGGGGYGTDGALFALIGCIILALLFVKYNLGISVALVGLGVGAFGFLNFVNYLPVTLGGLILVIGTAIAIMNKGQ